MLTTTLHEKGSSMFTDKFWLCKDAKKGRGGERGVGGYVPIPFPFYWVLGSVGEAPSSSTKTMFSQQKNFYDRQHPQSSFWVTFSRSSKRGHVTTWVWYQETWRWTDPAPFLHSENRCWIPRTLWAKKKLTSSHQYDHMTIITIICSYLLPDPPLNVWCASPASLDQPC